MTIKQKMKEPVIVKSEIKSKVNIENKFDFDAHITIGLAETGDFYLVLDFFDLTLEQYEILGNLCNLDYALSIKSVLFEQEDFNIKYIVITKFYSKKNMCSTWECLSDDPSMYPNFGV